VHGRIASETGQPFVQVVAPDVGDYNPHSGANKSLSHSQSYAGGASSDKGNLSSDILHGALLDECSLDSVLYYSQDCPNQSRQVTQNYPSTPDSENCRLAVAALKVLVGSMNDY
jgi:hypothetical protein